MTLRDGICAVVIGETLYIHSLLADGRTELAQTIYLSHVVGNVVISGESESSPVSDAATAPERFQLFITNKTGIYVYSVRQQDSTTFSADLIVEEETKLGASQSARPSYPLFGGSTSRVSWIYAPTSFFDRQPHLVTAKIQRKDGETKTCAAELSVVSECKDSKLPALYTLPVMHYDDGAGLMAIGNACGQLALCSFGGSMPSGLAGCFRDVPVPRMV
ncbi:hypothetical protein PHLCEN_2v3510 [Hermanssonia centrifuga]|uniref:Uncharacterized protein n=1 Tax=Hermanssonia centrifuga TaxID=98765 RepID=A0A2R6QEX2_9APHY|nr:hypothetical protein PHLCEN_2v3510 [Hermanssonia centrifuga]